MSMFVHGPYRRVERLEVANNLDSTWAYAYDLTNRLRQNPEPRVLDDFLREHPDYDLSTGGRSGYTALAVAIERKALPLIRHILDIEPRLINATCNATSGSETPLNIVVGNDDPEFAMAASSEMIARGADVNFTDRRGETPLFEAALRSDRAALIRLLLNHGGVIYQSARVGIGENIAHGEGDVRFIDLVNEQPANIVAAFEEVTLLRRGRLGINMDELPPELRDHIADFIIHE